MCQIRDYKESPVQMFPCKFLRVKTACSSMSVAHVELIHNYLHPSNHLSIRPSIHPSIHLSIHPFNHPTIYPTNQPIIIIHHRSSSLIIVFIVHHRSSLSIIVHHRTSVNLDPCIHNVSLSSHMFGCRFILNFHSSFVPSSILTLRTLLSIIHSFS